MDENKKIYDKESGVMVNIVVHEEKDGEKEYFIVHNEDLGVADFGNSLDEALDNFKKSMRLYLVTYPEKKKLLMEEETPLFISRILI